MTPKELKNSILQLAIQGRLVEQRPEEGTAQELYEQIQAEKQRLIQEGKIKKENPLPEITEDEKPFEIPESWMWVRLGNIVKSISAGGDKPKIFSKEKTEKCPIEVLSNGEKNCGIFGYTNIPTITERSLTVSGRGTIGYTEIRTQPYVPIVRLLAILPLKNTYLEYLKVVIQASSEYGIGSAVKQLTVPMLIPKLIPLPPLAEQKRIVAKIEELLPLVDRYEVAWTRLEDFNRRFPEDMKKSILQQAIQGKLVEQRPEEGTAQELYEEICTEKQRLIKEGKIKKEKPLPEITEDEKPFEIPEGWMWVRLADLCKSISDGDHQPPPQVLNGIPFLVISNISSGSIDFSDTRYVPQDYFNSLSSDRIAEYGDILFTVTGSYGIPVKVDTKRQFCFQRHVALFKLLVDWDYIFYVLSSPVFKSQCDVVATGTAQKTVGLKSLRNMILPLPPLAEQKRIVAQLEELLPLCERLKS